MYTSNQVRNCTVDFYSNKYIRLQRGNIHTFFDYCLILLQNTKNSHNRPGNWLFFSG